MTEALTNQFKSSLKWANCIRKIYPTLIFYFTQTYDQTTVIYYRDDCGSIQTVYTKLTIDSLTTCTPLPSVLSRHFTLSPIGTNRFILPGLVSSGVWELTPEGKFVQGDYVLVSTTGVVDKSTQRLECVYLVYVNTKTRKLEWSRMECAEEVKTLMSDLTNGIWTTLKSVIGASK
jgi:hypothetical protein